MDVQGILTLLGGMLGGGAAIGVVTKYLLDRQKDKAAHLIASEKQKHEQAIESVGINNEWNRQEFARLENRIIGLEEANRLCMAENSTLSKQLGMALGKIDGLVITVERLDATNSKRAAEATAALAVEKAKVVIDDVAAKAEAAIEIVTEKAIVSVAAKAESVVVDDGASAVQKGISEVQKTVDIIDGNVKDIKGIRDDAKEV